MITRKDATTGLYHYFDRACDENTCYEIINEIYDSIGSCGECRFATESISAKQIECSKGHWSHHKDWYCADFEGRIDEETEI